VSAAGFTALKLGWGAFREDIKTIMPLIEEARACLPAMRLIFDVGYERRRTAAELLELFAELERFDPLWIEDCCHPDDLETYRRLAAHSRAALAAGEAHATPYEFARLIDAGVEILQPDLSRCGGYTVAVQIASLATSANRRVIPHAWLNDLLLAATLQLCAALPDDTYLEYSVAHGPLQRVCSPSLPVLDGQVAVPPGPGIGVTPDPEILDRFSVSVPA
jgi:L-alanine-DL-glutamate epimerase-like enolase superfamily enzyme